MKALDPVSETRADPCSYGFCQGRSTQDAIEACFNVLSRRNDSAEWMLEGDIRACFDTLSHRWLIEHIPTHAGKLRAWLNVGYMEKGAFQLTTEGTPQGGILSPTAANTALDGLECALKARFRRHHKVHLVRSADDFIITGVSAALLADEVQPLVEQFLMERGLTLSREKTQIVHIEMGFDFPGFNVRKYHGKLLIKSAAPSIAAVKDKVRQILNTGTSQSQGLVIQRLNPVIRGWANTGLSTASSLIPGAAIWLASAARPIARYSCLTHKAVQQSTAFNHINFAAVQWSSPPMAVSWQALRTTPA